MVAIKHKWIWVTLLALAGSLVIVSACGSDERKALSGAEMEAEARSIDRLLMCPQCPSETIDQSGVELAGQMRQVVREKLAEGWTRQEILDYFSAPERYGPSVLASPPKEGFNLLVWVLPLGALATGILILYFVVKAMRRRHEVPQEEGAAELEAYLELVDQDLGIGEATHRSNPGTGGRQGTVTDG